MTATQAPRIPRDETPEAIVQKRSRFSLIMIVPIIAAAIGAWLLFRSLDERGLQITITFESAEGLEAGKSTIEYKSIKVGVVKALRFNEDLSRVIVHASIDREMEAFLNESTRFWVVRPQIGTSGISGLGTILSGPYIAMDPGWGQPTSAFAGLETPPVLKADAAGREYVLRADSLGSIKVGSAIYYHGVRAGEVISYSLTPDKSEVNLRIFIEEPYHGLVHESTQFWNASGIDVSVTADGMNLSTTSLESLLTGGIAFESPAARLRGERAPAGNVFRLHPRYHDITQHHGPTYSYVLYFEDSVRGLSLGAPVALKGINVGRVSDIRLELDEDSTTLQNPVTIEIEAEQIQRTAASEKRDFREVMAALVEQGLRARLRTGSLLTGQLFVALDFLPATPVKLIGTTGQPELPTISSGLEAIEESVRAVLTKLEKLPLEQMLQAAGRALEGIEGVLGSKETRDTLRAAKFALQAIGQLAGGIDQNVEALVPQIRETRTRTDTALEEVTGAAQLLRAFATYLEEHPEALLFGKRRDQ